jgi:Xrn1 helical domain
VLGAAVLLQGGWRTGQVLLRRMGYWKWVCLGLCQLDLVLSVLLRSVRVGLRVDWGLPARLLRILHFVQAPGAVDGRLSLLQLVSCCFIVWGLLVGEIMGFPLFSLHIPECWRHLMTDELSPIIDFYPTEFKTDLNGKRYAWQGVALLPFVDEKRLLGALESVSISLPLSDEWFLRSRV